MSKPRTPFSGAGKQVTRQGNREKFFRGGGIVEIEIEIGARLQGSPGFAIDKEADWMHKILMRTQFAIFITLIFPCACESPALRVVTPAADVVDADVPDVVDADVPDAVDADVPEVVDIMDVGT